MSLVTDKDLVQNISGSTSIRIMNTCNILGFSSHNYSLQKFGHVSKMCARKLRMLIFSVFGRPNSFQLEITTYGKFDPGFQNLPSDNFWDVLISSHLRVIGTSSKIFYF